jgi:nucleoid-associated protein YgaU
MGLASRVLLVGALVILAAGSAFLDREFARDVADGPRPPRTLTDLSVLADAPPEATTAYRVREGDTLREIAARVYGDADRWSLIRTPTHEEPGPLREGQILIVPGITPPRVKVKPYVVREGDSLYIISERVLGDGNLWRRIYDANRDKLKSPSSLRKGMVLRIRDEI